jgi:hypothetical protein
MSMFSSRSFQSIDSRCCRMCSGGHGSAVHLEQLYGSKKENYVPLSGIHQSRCYLAVIAAVLTPETLPIFLVHLVWTMDHSLFNSLLPSGTVSASACGTNLESYEFLMELANIRFLIQLLAIGC